MDDGLNDVNGNREQGRTRGAYVQDEIPVVTNYSKLLFKLNGGFGGRKKYKEKR